MSTAFDLTLDAVTQHYRGAASPAVDAVTLEIGAGELVALLGPSGCGKTTLLRIIAGFVQQTSGRVVVGGRPIDELPPHQREVGVVFQNYALFPHMSAADNVAYGLAARGAPRAEQQKKAAEMLALVQMSHLAQRLPREMSGGQQQRVALARALAVGPRILLLDEPTSSMDAQSEALFVKQLKAATQGVTLVAVTHRPAVLDLVDRVVVVDNGKVVMDGPKAKVLAALAGGAPGAAPPQAATAQPGPPIQKPAPQATATPPPPLPERAAA